MHQIAFFLSKVVTLILRIKDMSAVCLIVSKKKLQTIWFWGSAKKNYQQSDRWSMTNFQVFFNSAFRGCLRSSPSKSPFLKSHPSSSQHHQVLQSLHESKQIGSGWTFYRRICNVFSMIFFISEKWLISWNENFLFPIVVVNSQSNIVREVPIGIPHSHISFTNSSSSLGL